MRRLICPSTCFPKQEAPLLLPSTSLACLALRGVLVALRMSSKRCHVGGNSDVLIGNQHVNTEEPAPQLVVDGSIKMPRANGWTQGGTLGVAWERT